VQAGPNAWTTRQIARVFLTLAVLAGLLIVLYRIRSVLELVLVAGFLAIALGPPVEFLVRHRVKRALAIVLVYLGIIALIVGVGLLIIPPVVGGVNDLSHDIPGYVQDLRKSDTFRKYDDKYDISKKLNDQAKKLPSKLGEAAGTLQDLTVGVFGALVKLVTVLTMTFFLLLDGGKILHFFLRARGPTEEERLGTIFEGIYRSVAGYVAGNLVISFIAGGVTYITLIILGVPFAAPLAVLAGLMSLIPLIGATVAAIIIGLVTLFNDFPTDTIIWTIWAVIYQQIENNVIQPQIQRRTVQVQPFIVLVAVLFGSTLLGVLGAIVAIPLAASIQIVIREWWEWRAEVRAEQIMDPEGPGPDDDDDGGPGVILPAT
jgi:predicted PurR-regulated permease PerM